MRRSSWTTYELAVAQMQGEKPDVQVGDTVDGRKVVRVEPTDNWFVMHFEKDDGDDKTT